MQKNHKSHISDSSGGDLGLEIKSVRPTELSGVCVCVADNKRK